MPPATEYSYLKFEMQEDSQTLNEVVVKGLSPAEKVQRLAYNVSLVETAKLKSTTMDLSNVIDKISGVKIRSTGGVGSEANVTLNGFSGRHVKIFHRRCTDGRYEFRFRAEQYSGRSRQTCGGVQRCRTYRNLAVTHSAGLSISLRTTAGVPV